jgi:hypothetical protein
MLIGYMYVPAVCMIHEHSLCGQIQCSITQVEKARTSAESGGQGTNRVGKGGGVGRDISGGASTGMASSSRESSREQRRSDGGKGNGQSALMGYANTHRCKLTTNSLHYS